MVVNFPIRWNLSKEIVKAWLDELLVILATHFRFRLSAIPPSQSSVLVAFFSRMIEINRIAGRDKEIRLGLQDTCQSRIPQVLVHAFVSAAFSIAAFLKEEVVHSRYDCKADRVIASQSLESTGVGGSNAAFVRPVHQTIVIARGWPEALHSRLYDVVAFL